MGKINHEVIWEHVSKLLPRNMERFTEVVIDEESIYKNVKDNFPSSKISIINVKELLVSDIETIGIWETIANFMKGDFIFFKITEDLENKIVDLFSDIFRRLNYNGCKVILLNEDVKRTGQNYEGYPFLELDIKINRLFRGRRNPLLYKNF